MLARQWNPKIHWKVEKLLDASSNPEYKTSKYVEFRNFLKECCGTPYSPDALLHPPTLAKFQVLDDDALNALMAEAEKTIPDEATATHMSTTPAPLTDQKTMPATEKQKMVEAPNKKEADPRYENRQQHRKNRVQLNIVMHALSESSPEFKGQPFDFRVGYEEKLNGTIRQLFLLKLGENQNELASKIVRQLREDEIIATQQLVTLKGSRYMTVQIDANDKASVDKILKLAHMIETIRLRSLKTVLNSFPEFKDQNFDFKAGYENDKPDAPPRRLFGLSLAENQKQLASQIISRLQEEKITATQRVFTPKQQLPFINIRIDASDKTSINRILELERGIEENRTTEINTINAELSRLYTLMWKDPDDEPQPPAPLAVQAATPTLDGPC